MRLHALTIDAFGPFVAPQRVDFDELGSAGVFLVHGATGAGKTSVLDAVCYALFSDVPGARPSRGLRADLAPPERATVVTLEFTSAGRRFRVTRSPEYVRPRLRGTGTTTAPARVALSERVQGAWVVRSTRIDEAADLLKDVIGMGLAQFQRVAVLPQGQFADFLRAEPRERHQLLTALFDVRGFEDVESWLAQRRRRLADVLADLEREFAYHVRALAELCTGLPGEAGPSALGPDPALAETPPDQWASAGPALVTRLEALATQALGDAERTARRAVECQQAHDSALHADRLRRRAATAQAHLARLGADRDLIAGHRHALRAAAAAGELRGDLARLSAAEDLSEEASVAAEVALEAATASLGTPVAAADVDGLLSALRANSASLDLARAAIAERRVARLARRAAAAELDRASAGEQRSAAELARGLIDHASRAEAHDRVRARAEGRALIQVARERLEHERSLIRELIDRLETLDSLSPAIVTARERLVTAREDLVTQQQRRLDDLAGELAAGLAPKAPCPVCGSCSHPRPADPAPGWSVEGLDAARLAVDAASEDLAALESRRQSAAAVRDGLLAQLAARPEPDATSGLPAGGPGRSSTDWPAQLADLDSVSGYSTSGPPARSSTDWRAELADLDAQWVELRAQASAADGAAAQLPSLQAAAAADALAATALREAASRAAADVVAARRLVEASDERVADAAAALSTALGTHTAGCPCALQVAPGPPAWAVPPAGAGTSPPAAEAETAATVEAATTAQTAPTDQVADAASLLDGHDRLEAALDTARLTADRAMTAQAALTDARGRFDAAVARSSFADRAGVESALLSPARVIELQDCVVAHDQQLAIHRATLAEPEIGRALDDPEPIDPLRTQEGVAKSREDAQRADRARHDTDRIAREARSAIGAVVGGAEALVTARADLAQAAAIADLAAGTSPENTLRMRLSTFVLASRLERVVDLANERLARMGEGRFQLEHDDSLAGHGARSGLGLRVRDNWSGTARTPSSLSGGESFIASLALALGLADTLRESVGGIELQSLFIDEGFGALDEASLDEVLSVLDTLRDGGRAVGVVSHVPELRDRIPAQLSVTKSPQGSTLSTTGPRLAESA